MELKAFLAAPAEDQIAQIKRMGVFIEDIALDDGSHRVVVRAPKGIDPAWSEACVMVIHQYLARDNPTVRDVTSDYIHTDRRPV